MNTLVTTSVPTMFPDVPVERYWIPQEVLFSIPGQNPIFKLLAYPKYLTTGAGAPFFGISDVTVLARDNGDLIVVASARLPASETVQTSPNRFGYEMPDGNFEILCEGKYFDLGNFQVLPVFGRMFEQKISDCTMMLYQNIKTGEYHLSQPRLSSMTRVYQK